MTVEITIEEKDETIEMMEHSGKGATISLSDDVVVETHADGRILLRIETLHHQGTERHIEIDGNGTIRWTNEDTVGRVEVETVEGLVTANHTANRVRHGEQALGGVT